MSAHSKISMGLNYCYKNECHCVTFCLKLDGRPCIKYIPCSLKLVLLDLVTYFFKFLVKSILYLLIFYRCLM
jgi:hypothetical protein